MFPHSCPLIETRLFPVLEQEDVELMSQELRGNGFAPIHKKLPLAGFQVMIFFNEDCGWWLQTERHG
jgi:hypothetical protein